MRVVQQEGEGPLRRVRLEGAEETVNVEVGGGDGPATYDVRVQGKSDDVSACVPFRDDARHHHPGEERVEVVEDRKTLPELL